MSFFAATNRPPVCPSVPAFASTFHHRLHWYFIRWLETPTACGSQISKVIWQISRSHRPKKPSDTGQIQGFRVFSGERMGKRPEIPYAAVSWPPNYILITVCWFYWFWWHFDSMKYFKCVVSVFDGERMTVMAWNLACRCILTTLRTAYIWSRSADIPHF